MFSVNWQEGGARKSSSKRRTASKKQLAALAKARRALAAKRRKCDKMLNSQRGGAGLFSGIGSAIKKSAQKTAAVARTGATNLHAASKTAAAHGRVLALEAELLTCLRRQLEPSGRVLVVSRAAQGAVLARAAAASREAAARAGAADEPR